MRKARLPWPATPLLALLALIAIARSEEEADARAGKHALLVGCTDYPRLRAELGEARYRAGILLEGPGNDVKLLRGVLVDVLGYPGERITVLTGWDENDEASRPTRANILSHLDRLAKVVRKGDRVMILLSGHGSQQIDRNGDELDGLDEIFLPADAAKWKLEIGEVENSLSDDEIGTRVKAIRDAGAMVWIVFDCCHSGTMVRGATAGVRERRIDPDVLGVPRPPLARGAPADETSFDVGDEDLRNIVALSAAQSYRTAPEMPLPREEENAGYYGLLSYTLASQIRRRGGGISFRELHAQLVQAYQAFPWYGTMPQADGDLGLSVGGGAADRGPLLLVGKLEGRLTLSAGILADIPSGTILEIFRPGKPGEEKERVGFARVTEAGPVESVLEPLERDGLELPDLEGLDQHPARVIERPFGDHRLWIAYVDPDGRPLSEVPPAVALAFEHRDIGWRFPTAETPRRADWLVVVDGDELRLRPARSGGGCDLTFKVEDARALVNSLSDIFRYENLKRFADDGGISDLEKGPTVRVIKIVDEIETDLKSGEALHPGEKLKISVRNDTEQNIDLWIFFLDAHYGVHQLFPPRKGGRSPRLSHQDRKEVELGTWPVTSDSLGDEHLLVIAIPREEEAPYVFLDFLTQRPQDVTRSGVRTRGAWNPLTSLFRELAFGRTRGLDLDVGDGPAAKVSLVSWRTEWGAVEPCPVLSPGNELRERPETREEWRPAPSRARARGGLADLYTKLAPSIFVVRNRAGHGTGFLVDREGHVLTNHHVIDVGFTYTRRGLRRLTLVRGELDENGVMRALRDDIRATVVHADRRRDLALLRITSPAPWLAGLHSIELSDASPRPGLPIVVLGHPGSDMLWSIREGKVSGVGRFPHDFTDRIVRRLFATDRQKLLIERQLAHADPVQIVLSDCQANPGDSGGPLLDTEGRLVGVTHATPAEEQADELIYHIHADEVRAFLAARPAPEQELEPQVPDPWRLGPNVCLKRTAYTRKPFDVLQAGDDQPRQFLFDLDDDSTIDSLDAEGTLKLVRTRSFESEIALHYLPDRKVAFYDTDNRDGFDLVLVDDDEDDRADVRFILTKSGWTVETEVSVPWLASTYLKSPGLQRIARRKLQILRR